MDHTITGVNITKSNGSMAGISSMPTLNSGFISNAFGKELDKVLYGNTDDKLTVEAFVEKVSRSASEVFAKLLATQLSSRPALLVQERTSRLVTKLQTAALWFLVTTNLLYVVFSISLAVLALVATSDGVHQVHTRLSIAGLVAELFEKPYSRRAVSSDSDLFENSDSNSEAMKCVEVAMTDEGVSEFVLCERG